MFVRRTLEHHLQNIECNSTSAVAITHHFLGQLVRTTNSLLTTHKPRQFRGKHCLRACQIYLLCLEELVPGVNLVSIHVYLLSVASVPDID